MATIEERQKTGEYLRRMGNARYDAKLYGENGDRFIEAGRAWSVAQNPEPAKRLLDEEIARLDVELRLAREHRAKLDQ